MSARDLDARLATIASRQHSLITHEQATVAGATRAFIRHRLDTGRWWRVHPGVYGVAGTPVTWEMKVHAGVLAGGVGTLASHRAAGVLWGVEGFRRGTPEISVARHRLPEHLPIRVHESTDLDLARPTRRLGIPTTGLLRTLLDCGLLVSQEVLEGAVEQVVRETSFEWPDLYDTLVVHSRRGRNGCGPFRAVLDESFGDRVITDSTFERLVRNLLADAGIEPPVSQHAIYDGDAFVAEVDLAWPDRSVAVELQSRKHHMNTQRWERDMERLNHARLLGWNVLEYPWRFYVQQPARMVKQIETALEQRSRSD
jgi:hypothetical protein